METTLFLEASGFVVGFILLFVFTAKYRAALARETDFDSPVEEMTVTSGAAEASFKSRAAVLQSAQGSSALEMADVKEKMKELQYQLEEMKIRCEKANGELAQQLASLEARIGTFEQEYVNKLQPTLMSLIEELENMKVAELQEK